MGTLATNEIGSRTATARQPTHDIGRRFPASRTDVLAAATARQGGAPVDRGAHGLTGGDSRQRVVGADPFAEYRSHAS
jgi:hypothetical protein